MDNKDKRQYLDVLQILRGTAAILVVFHHSIGSLKYYHKLDNEFILFIGLIGKFGVDFFFVLSGFIIAYSSYFKESEPGLFKKYIINRFLRIYIPYLPIGIFMLVLYTFFPSFSSINHSTSILTTLTLIPQGNPALSVAWTLSFEMFFYLLFSITFFSKKAWNVIICIWVVVILVFANFKVEGQGIVMASIKVITSPYNLEFILGYILSLFITQKIQINKTIQIVAICFLFVSFIVSLYYITYLIYFVVNFIFSLLGFALFYYAITNYNIPIKKTSYFMMIGNATYSIYLIHNPLQVLIIRLCPKIDTLTLSLLLLFVVTLLCCIVGYIYYKVFEVYFLKKTRLLFLKE